MKRNLIAIVLISAAALGYYAFQQYNKTHPDLSQSKVDFRLSASDLFNTYSDNESAADSIYLGKTLEVTGSISNIDRENTSSKIYLDTGDALSSVLCEMDDAVDISHLSEGDAIVIRGIVAGSLMDVVLNRCILIDNK